MRSSWPSLSQARRLAGTGAGDCEGTFGSAISLLREYKKRIMGKSLVIVESPAKAKTINKYLGSDFIVKSSIGHIRDLPTSGGSKPVDPKERARQAALTRKMAPDEKAVYKAKKQKQQLINRMGIDPENDWEARYEILPGKEKVVDELKKLAARADTIYLATDLDREGEAIAWHLQQAIGGDRSEEHTSELQS